MKITVEVTPEIYTIVLNGVEVPHRIWRGKTEGGVEIKLYAVSIVPANPEDASRLEKEVEPFMRRSKDMFIVQRDRQ